MTITLKKKLDNQSLAMIQSNLNAFIFGGSEKNGTIALEKFGSGSVFKSYTLYYHII